MSHRKPVTDIEHADVILHALCTVGHVPSQRVNLGLVDAYESTYHKRRCGTRVLEADHAYRLVSADGRDIVAVHDARVGGDAVARTDAQLHAKQLARRYIRQIISLRQGSRS